MTRKPGAYTLNADKQEAEAANEQAARTEKAIRLVAQTSQTLDSEGLTLKGLVASLEALEGKLTILESVFLMDFRLQVSDGSDPHGQWKKASAIVAKYAE